MPCSTLIPFAAPLGVITGQPMESATPKIYDWVFLAAALAFNLLIASLFVAEKHRRTSLCKLLGITWLFLAIPLTSVLVIYHLAGRPVTAQLRLGLVLLFMLVEWLLDFALKLDFRSRPLPHAAYIALEYVALFSLIGVATEINLVWGWLVGVAFWILIACLIYLYWDSIKRTFRRKKTESGGGSSP
jgi:hypothetical protein